jgi:hypothetical protein
MLQYPERAFELQVRALNILRMLRENNPQWEATLAAGIEIHLLTSPGQLESEEEIALREELDGLYAPSTHPVAEIKRLENRRRIAWLSFRESDAVENQSVDELLSRAIELRKASTLGNSANDELLFIEADLYHLKGLGALQDSDNQLAHDFLSRAVSICSDVDWEGAKAELKRSTSEAHVLLALRTEFITSTKQRCDHAVEAARINGAGLSGSAFFDLLTLLSENCVDSRLVLFLEFTLGIQQAQNRASSLVFHFSRNAQSATRFLSTAIHTVSLLHKGKLTANSMVLQRIAAIADAIVIQASRRKLFFVQGRHGEVVDLYFQLVEALGHAGLDWVPNADVLAGLQMLTQVRTPAIRPKTNQ